MQADCSNGEGASVQNAMLFATLEKKWFFLPHLYVRVIYCCGVAERKGWAQVKEPEKLADYNAMVTTGTQTELAEIRQQVLKYLVVLFAFVYSASLFCIVRHSTVCVSVFR